MGAAAKPERKSKNPIIALIDYIIEGMDRTLFPSVRFALPRKFVSPYGFLGVLTGVTFLVLGITGAVLMFPYEPSVAGAYESVARINEITDRGTAVSGAIPYGYLLRNIHYHASNAMVLLAVLHLYYQYFSGRYKIKNEILWASGVILGALTTFEAYTGYDLIFNDRAILAINIGGSLTNASPLIGPLVKNIVFGQTYAETILRLYSYHVFIVPILMLVFVFLHFPRNLVLDIPMNSILIGGIIMVAGLFPVSLGFKFDPNNPFLPVTVPEWYVAAPYAFLRTQFERFITGLLACTGSPLCALPTVAWLIIPWVDSGRKLSWKDRPFFTAFGIATVTQTMVAITFGFYTVPPAEGVTLLQQLSIEPLPFYSVLLAVTVVSMALTYAYLRYVKAKEARGVRRTVEKVLLIRGRWLTSIVIAIIGFQVLLNALAYQAYLTGFRNIALFEIGMAIVLFGVIFHIHRYGKQFG